MNKDFIWKLEENAVIDKDAGKEIIKGANKSKLIKQNWKYGKDSG
jgi:hypothetical protein